MGSNKKSAVLKLPGNKKYSYLIRKSVSTKQLWSLADSGEWVYFGDHKISQIFVLWPKKEFAELYSTGIVSKYESVPIELDHFINTIIPELIRKEIKILVFPTLEGKGVLCDAEKVRDDIMKGLDASKD